MSRPSPRPPRTQVRPGELIVVLWRARHISEAAGSGRSSSIPGAIVLNGIATFPDARVSSFVPWTSASGRAAHWSRDCEVASLTVNGQIVATCDRKNSPFTADVVQPDKRLLELAGHWRGS